MMEDYTLFRTLVLINHTYTKVTLSLDEIKEKHPERRDIIDSMSMTKDELQEIATNWRALELEYRAAIQNAFRLEIINMELKRKIEHLELDIKAREL
jgi:hypothetical protein